MKARCRFPSSFHLQLVYVIGLLAALTTAGCGGDDSADGNGNETPDPDGADPERFAMEQFEVVGAGELLEDPEQDDSVTITSAGGDVVPVEPGAMLTVSIPFEAEQGNVVGAGIRFGQSGPIVTVPMPSMRGATAGTLTFDVQVPADLCSELGSICHDIRCYEFAVTEDGLVSAANIQQMAAACGECTDPSCIGVIEGCELEIPETPADFCPAPAVETLFMGNDLNPPVAVDEEFLYFGLDGDLVRLAKDGSGTPEVLAAGVDATQVLVLDDMLYIRGVTQIDRLPKDGGEPELVVGYVSGSVVTDGEAIYAGARLACVSTGEITRLDPDGTETVLAEDEPCVKAIAVDEEHLYWLGDVDADSDLRHVMRVEKAGGTPQELVAPGEMRGPIAIDESYVYYWGEENGFRRPLMRAPKDGSGAPDELVPELPGGAIATRPGEDAVYFTDASYDGCMRRVDEGGAITSIASQTWQGEDAVLDDDYVYVGIVDIDLNYSIVRAPKQ